MAGGYRNITGKDGNTFSKENQPANRKKSTRFLTDLLTKQLKVKGDIEIQGKDKETGQPITILVSATNKEALVAALLKQASRGNVLAIKEVFDRIEGKVIQGVASTDMQGQDAQPQLIIIQNDDYVTRSKQSESDVDV